MNNDMSTYSRPFLMFIFTHPFSYFPPPFLPPSLPFLSPHSSHSLQSLWVYASICAGLNLRPLLSSLFHVLTTRTIRALVLSRHRLTPPTTLTDTGDLDLGGDPSSSAMAFPMESLARLLQAENEAVLSSQQRRHTSNTHTTTTTTSNPGAPSAGSFPSSSPHHAHPTTRSSSAPHPHYPPLDWHGTSAIKGEIMVKVILSPTPYLLISPC